MAVQFVPATTATLTDASSRKLRFTQNEKGDVYVKVEFGSSEINTIFQDKVFVKSNTEGLQGMGDITLENLNRVQRKKILQAIGHDITEIQTEDGRITEIEKRNSDGFYHEVRSVVIILK